MKKLIALLLAACAFAGTARASEGGIAWDKFPQNKMTDVASLQHGAKLFVNYCLNCHSAAYMRYNRLQEIGLSEAQIKGNLLFATDKVGETMKVAAPSEPVPFAPQEGKAREICDEQWLEVRNVYYEVTPSRLITSYITEQGVLDPSDVQRFSGEAEKRWQALMNSHEL